MATKALGAVFDTCGILVELIPGEGGDDAKLFAEELFFAYLAYLNNNKLEAELEETGPNIFSFVCEDMKAETLFSSEAGVHCVQRVPRNGKGKKHTSYVTVSVTKLMTSTHTLNESDLEETFQRGHGKGGQHQNKTDSAVRLRHKPTGLEVFINGRSQQANRKTARACMAGKIDELLKKNISTKTIVRPSRGNKIRTYNLTDSRVTDHVSGAKCHYPPDILKAGKFELLR